TEIMYDPAGVEETLEFVEIMNVGGGTADISGWQILEGVAYEFPPETQIAANEIIVVARDPALFAQRYPTQIARIFGPFLGSLANGGEELRLVDRADDFPATIDYVRYDDGGDWPDIVDGFSIELTEVSAERDNDRAQHWAQSPVSGGTPGSLEPQLEFLRGDVDGNSLVNLSDSVRVLNYLFIGGQAPVCLDAADADDDGDVRLNDAIYLLNYLFLGGDTIPEPFPEPGEDPTEDGLDC
ncbi:MAG: lamin tail domain-containing protein, partial [Planctomycetota bacterium]